MYRLGNAVIGGMLRPIDANGANKVSTVPFDTANGGANPVRECLAILMTGNVAADTTVFQLEECETSNGSFTVVQGQSTTLTWTLALGATGDNKIWTAHIPMGGVRKRFLGLSVTGGAAATLVAGVIIGLGCNQSPNSDTERGNGNTATSADGIMKHFYIPNNT